MPDIDIASIDTAIGTRFRWLRFDAVLERLFEQDAVHRCRSLIRHNYIGLAVYDLFLFGDCKLVPDVFTFSVVLHFAIMTPLMLAANYTLTLRPPVWLREGLAAFTIILTTFCILLLMLLSRAPMRTSEHLSIVLVILFGTMIQTIRFWYVLVACLLSLALYVGCLWQLFPAAPERTLVADAVFACVVLFSLVGCYNLEHEQRMGFLLRTRDRLRLKELEALSCRDALTGVGNRRALDLALERAGKDAASPSTAILLCDIDYFKAFNDANGHLVGDACLRQVAGLLAGELRKADDSAYRFGGEEFLVLLPGTDTTTAVIVAERIRTAVARAAIMTGTEHGPHVTISIGHAAGRITNEEDVSALIADADAALYTAKNKGRDQVWPQPAAEVHQKAA